MGQKSWIDEVHVVMPTYAGAGPQIDITDAAAFNTQFATAMDTSGFEANGFILYFAEINNVLDMVFTMFESDVSAADAGTAVDHSEVRVTRHDGVVTKCPATTGVLTTSAAADENSFWLFEYLGDARWIRLTASVGTANITVGLMGIQMHPRRAPEHAVAYAGP